MDKMKVCHDVLRAENQPFADERDKKKFLDLVEEQKKEKDKPAVQKKAAPRTDRQLARVEREIAKTEEQLAALDGACEENASDYQKLLELGAERDKLNEALEALYAEWEALSE